MFSQDELHSHDELHPLPFSMQEHEVFEHPFTQLHFFESLSLDIIRYLSEKSIAKYFNRYIRFGIVRITNEG
jgi:hypothetical protein